MSGTATAEMEGVARGAWPQRVGLALRDIKLAHSVFALPFAVLGAFLAAPMFRGEGATAGGGWGRFAGQLGLVVVCMVFARTWAMLVNRIADRAFDAANPRTAGRALASGRLGRSDAVRIAVIAGLAFVVCCGLFWMAFDNPWPLMLALPTLVWIAFYSFTKRFTWASHLFLGGALAASPVAAAIAVDPTYLWHGTPLWCLASMVLCWVAGFDVLYSLQDEAFDRGVGLRSVPARWGGRSARWMSRGLHALAFGALVLVWVSDPRLGTIFGVAGLGVGALLVWEHVHLSRRGIAGLPVSFGLINGVVALAVGSAGCFDVMLRG
ncbi:MAG: 4-hydroxybenzoate octaprenyltransferase [Phycisphaerales bacterium]